MVAISPGLVEEDSVVWGLGGVARVVVEAATAAAAAADSLAAAFDRLGRTVASSASIVGDNRDIAKIEIATLLLLRKRRILEIVLFVL